MTVTVAVKFWLCLKLLHPVCCFKAGLPSTHPFLNPVCPQMTLSRATVSSPRVLLVLVCCVWPYSYTKGKCASTEWSREWQNSSSLGPFTSCDWYLGDSVFKEASELCVFFTQMWWLACGKSKGPITVGRVIQRGWALLVWMEMGWTWEAQ